jgi:MFS family permease
LGFAIGAVLGLAVLLARRFVPESPRWLVLHGHQDQAEQIMSELEARLGIDAARSAASASEHYLLVQPHQQVSIGQVLRTLFQTYPRRAALGLTLIASQAFLYNAIFFTYALVLVRFYNVPESNTGLYLLPFAISNFLGPLLLGRFFDTIGRRVCIAFTYSVSGLMLLLTGVLFVRGGLDANGQTMLWALIFFFASAAASAAYLTVSELFPQELRALAIAIFFAFGTAIGGVAAPWLFGLLIGTGERMSVFYGYAFGAVLMLIAALVEIWLGIDSEGKSLEQVATPLSVRVD